MRYDVLKAAALGAAWLVLWGSIATPARAGGPVPDEPIEIGTTPQLFLDDDYLVDNRFAIQRNTSQVLPKLHTPLKHGKAPVFSDPGVAPVGICVKFDPEAKLYRLWYQASIPTVIGEKRKEGEGLVGYRHVRYAESKDGLQWTRPELGLHEYRGNKLNNICLMRPGTFEQKTSGYGISSIRFLDTELMPEADRRGYKYLMTYTLRGGDYAKDEGPDVYLIGSKDGIRWDREHQQAILTGKIVDGWFGNVYDPRLRKYVSYARPRNRYQSSGPESPSNKDFLPDPLIYEGVVRRIGRMESETLWSKQTADPQTVFLPDAVDMKNGVHAHMRMVTRYYAGVHFGFLMPYVAHELVWTELVLSRDSKSFTRTHERLIPLGAADSWDSQQAWASVDWVEKGDEWWIYYTGANRPPNLAFQEDTRYAVGLAKIRKEGFVSMNVPKRGGVLITRLLKWPGGDLLVNCDTTDGEMRVRVSDGQRAPLPGFNYGDCLPFSGDSVAHKVTWKDNSMDKLKGKIVRLEFYFSNKADLYSFRARLEPERSKQ